MCCSKVRMSDDILEIVLKYGKLAKSMSGRVILFKDKTMLPFLAYSISSETASLEVIEAAIEALFLLSSHDSNVIQLKETYGVFEALQFVNKRGDLPSYIKEKVTLLLKRLEERDAPAYCTRSKTKSLTGSGRSMQVKTSKLINIHVHGMTKDYRRELETAIIAVHGVVSVVLDVEHQRCCLRVYDTLAPLDIAIAIYEQTGLEAKLVSRNRLGQEILQPLLESSCNDSTDDHEDWPSYLQEEDSPVKKEAISKMFLIKERPGNWLNSAMGFLQKSFYW